MEGGLRAVFRFAQKTPLIESIGASLFFNDKNLRFLSLKNKLAPKKNTLGVFRAKRETARFLLTNFSGY